MFLRFSILSQKIARFLLQHDISLEDLEEKYAEYAALWNDKDAEDKPPFCCVESIKYAINARKFAAIEYAGHVRICVPFYKEFERGAPATEENPNGEESPVQKIDEVISITDSIVFSKNQKLYYEFNVKM